MTFEGGATKASKDACTFLHAFTQRWLPALAGEKETGGIPAEECRPFLSGISLSALGYIAQSRESARQRVFHREASHRIACLHCSHPVIPASC